MADRRHLMVSAMDAALQAGVRIDDVQRWCRDNDVNPRTFYRHRARIRAEGVWRERSHRPLHSPGATPPQLDALIRRLREELGIDNGADFIHDALTGIHERTRPAPPWTVPARSTINRVLDRHDLLHRNPAKRPRSSWKRFAYAQPRDCYQIDATEVTLAHGTAVVFDVLDDCTRMLVACHAAPAETTNDAITAITTAFQTHGTPAIVLSDNGIAFTSRYTKPGTGPSRFTRTVHDAGARLIHSSPYHPQTCGKVERHHQTLKHWLRNQPEQPTTLTELQHQLDTYRQHYNQHRAHSALNRATPHHAWTNAATHGGPTHLPTQTDAIIRRCPVHPAGVISIAHHNIGVGRHLHGRTLTVIRNNNHATIYTEDGNPLGTATLIPGKVYTKLNRHQP